MNFLRELNSTALLESDDLSELPYDVVNELQNHIRNGAKDMSKDVENALELTKEAYKVENVELPNPAMKKAWEQFSSLIEYATQNLLKYRGIDGDWRMSTYMFREAINEIETFAVTIRNGESITQTTIQDKSRENIIRFLKKQLKETEFTLKTTEESNQITIALYMMGVKQPITMTLTKLL